MHVEEDSKHLTALCTPFGVFEWNVLPMGIKVGPAAYQEMVQHITHNCPSSKPYIDDIMSSNGKETLDPGKTTLAEKQEPAMLRRYFEAHTEKRCTLFDALAAAQLTVKPEKCHLFKKKVQYAGHILKNGQRFPSPAKTEAVVKWDDKTITTAKQLKGFLGLVGWYQVYIPKFAELATPLMEALKGKYQYAPPDPTDEKTDTNVPKKRKRIKLTAKEARIDCSDVMVKKFSALKQALVGATGLYLPKPGQLWRIRCDASHYAVGRALERQQEDGEDHPVAFFSRKFQGQRAGTGAGKRDTRQYAWTPREKETYADVACLLKFHAWIGSQEVVVQTDHSSIVKWYKEDLCTISGPLGRRGRWHECLTRFNLTIEYRPGKDTDGADALSRCACPAGEAQDTNFHGSDADLEVWRHNESGEWHRIRSELKSQKPFPFREEQAMVSLLQSARVQAVMRSFTFLCPA